MGPTFQGLRMGGTWLAEQWADTEKLWPVEVGVGRLVRHVSGQNGKHEHLPCENRNCLYPMPSCTCSHMTLLSHLLGPELLFPL